MSSYEGLLADADLRLHGDPEQVGFEFPDVGAPTGGAQLFQGDPLLTIGGDPLALIGADRAHRGRGGVLDRAGRTDHRDVRGTDQPRRGRLPRCRCHLRFPCLPDRPCHQCCAGPSSTMRRARQCRTAGRRPADVHVTGHPDQPTRDRPTRAGRARDVAQF